ncbi:NAD(P)-dependent oxidoreductase [Prolixibacteraceae bacterium JC049]|nr:NAD(P)-dependent oxidoreductase [Prolixibacteraceae bacterium JC049]
MANVLITGASGFIGSFLVEKGLELGHTIYAAIRQSSSKKYLQDKRINFVYVQLDNTESLTQQWKQLKAEGIHFDYVVHNAGVTKVRDNDEFDQVNNGYTQNLMNSLAQAEMQPKKFIFVSSLAAYGPGKDNFQPIKDADIPCPVTHYGKSKLKAENFLKEQDLMPYLIFRPTGVYGPRETDYYTFFKSINNHIEVYIGSSSQLLSFIHVFDLVDVIFKSMNSEIVNKAYFVTDGNSYTTQQFAQITKQLLQKRTVRIVIPAFIVKCVFAVTERWARFRNQITVLNKDKYNELISENWSCNSTQTMIDFNFKPEYTLKKGVKVTLDWYKKNKWL